METSINLEFKFDSEKVEPSLLEEREIEKYDFEFSFMEVLNKINSYISYEFKYPMMKRPLITNKYEVRYECFVPRKVDKVGNYVEEKLTFEEEVKRLYSDIAAGLSNMTKIEFDYYINCLYQKKSDNSFKLEFDVNRPKFDKIKRSCIMKLAFALCVAKEKNK